MTSRALADALRRGGDCPVLSAGDASLEPYAFNFGRHRRAVPRVVVLASRAEHVANALRVARAFRVPVSVRGAGHSCGRQGLVSGGILIVNRTDQPDVRLIGEDRVEASGRTSWRDLERILNRAGRMSPVRTNQPGTTIGGTLSVGGYGPRSISRGAQTDHVERLEVILPDGTMRVCSLEKEPELFQCVLGGLGQLGVIERVVMRSFPRLPWRRVRVIRHRSLTALAEAIVQTPDEEGPDELQAIRGREPGWACYLADGFPSERLARARGRRPGDEAGWVEPDAPEAVGGSADEDRHFWCAYAFPASAFPAFAAFVEGRLQRGPLRGDVARLYVLCLRGSRAGRRAALDLRSWVAPHRGLAISVDLDAAPGDHRAARRAREFQRECLWRALSLGGRPYLCGSQPIDASAFPGIYGPAYARLRALRDRLDPDGLYNRGVP